MINLSDPVLQMFIVALIVAFLPIAIILFLAGKTARKGKQPRKSISVVNTLTLIRLVQVVLICGIIWFVAWAHIYEVVIWNKAFAQTFYTSFGNVLSYALLSVVLIGTEYILRRYKRFVTLNQTGIPNVSAVTPKTLIENLQKLESEKEAFKRELWELKRKPRGTIGYALLVSGVIALLTSILFESTIVAFIGLALAFWGASLTFIKPSKYARIAILDSTAISSLATIDKIISDLDYDGKAIYLPPRHLKELRSEKVFIPSEKNASVPPAEEVAEDRVFRKNPHTGMFIVPPGLALADLFETELNTDFVKVDLQYLQNSLPKLLIENLEMAESFKMNVNDNIVHVEIIGSTLQNLCKEARKLLKVCGSLGCPICSSIAVALTRATGKAVLIEADKVSADGKTIEIQYKLVEA